MGMFGMAGWAGAADTKPKASKAEARACERSCGDPARTDPTQYERCMLDCPMPAPDENKRKHKHDQPH
jgi:hypothetical protein